MAKMARRTSVPSPAAQQPPQPPREVISQDIVFDADVEAARKSAYGKYFEPYKREMPQHVLYAFKEANDTRDDTRAKAIKRAVDKAEVSYYAAWARGEIKNEPKEPMSEETKEKLRQLNKERREKEKAEKVARKERLAAIDAVNAPKATVQVVSKPAQATKQKIKIPVFSDPDAQKVAIAKYPHIIPGSFKQDPEKAGGTCVEIKCTKCGAARTIHLCDVFQCRLCHSCRISRK